MANKPRMSTKTPARCAWACGLLALWLSGGMAQAQSLGVSLHDARLSLLPGDMPGAGYFSLQNDSAETVTLVGAQSDAFTSTEMHMSREKDGMASMHAVQALDIPAGKRLAFAPKGYHLMFMNRLAPLSVGDDVQVVLRFADGQRLPATLTVVSPATMH
ncbi:copper chaperone PCu(A)C [Onishia taeanensis]